MNQGYNIFWQSKDDSELLIKQIKDQSRAWSKETWLLCKNQPGLEGNDDPT